MMKREKNVSKSKVLALCFSLLMLGLFSHLDFAVAGQAQRGSISVTVVDNDGIVVGESVQFQIQVNEQSDAACDDGTWTLDYGDGRSGTGMATGIRRHTYLTSGAYNAVVSYTYFLDVGVGGPDCQPQTDSDSVSVMVNEIEMPDATSEPVRYVGTNSNWFDPENWDQGRIPGEDDDVVIEGEVVVIIDPEMDPRAGSGGSGARKVNFQDLILLQGAQLETRPGTELTFGTISSDGTGNLNGFSSGWSGTALSDGWGCPFWKCGFNPTYVYVDHFEFDGEGLAMFLGGAQPAAPGMTGAGYYANVRAEQIELIGVMLQVDLIYDFQPQPGDEFVIFEASESLTGTFINYEEGDVVLSTGTVELMIHYRANQIVLTAESIN